MVVEGLFRAQEKIPGFVFSRCRVLRELRFREDEEADHTHRLDIDFYTEDYDSVFEIKFLFKGITRLHLGGLGGGESRIIGFDIIDISYRGWEDINFEVIDFEGNLISFLCKNAMIVSIEKVE